MCNNLAASDRRFQISCVNLLIDWIDSFLHPCKIHRLRMNDFAVLACLQRLSTGASLFLATDKIVCLINLDFLIVTLVANYQFQPASMLCRVW